jgi:hypothetical protein
LANPAGDALTPAQITQALREIAGEAGESFIEDDVDVTCRSCGKRQKVRARMRNKGADPRVRLDAIKFATEQGYGKPGQAKTEERLDLDIDVQTLTPDARASLRRKLLALNPDLPQTWIG